MVPFIHLSLSLRLRLLTLDSDYLCSQRPNPSMIPSHLISSRLISSLIYLGRLLPHTFTGTLRVNVNTPRMRMRMAVGGWMRMERLSHSRSLLSLTSHLLLLAFDFLLTYAALSIPYLVFGLGLVFPQIGDSCLINRPATSSKIDAPRVQRASESWAMENTPCDIDDHG